MADGSQNLFAEFMIPRWLGNWTKRRRISIDHGDVDGDLAHFPVLLHLSANSGIGSDDVTSVFDEVGSNSKKIAVTKSDGMTQLYVEIETWNAVAEEAWLWVSRADWIISSMSDSVLFLYYDNAQPDNTTYVGTKESAPAESVWDSNFKAVYHLQEGTAPTAKDSTSNNRDLTGGHTRGGVSAKIANGQDFEANNDDYLGKNFIFPVSTNDLTVECWVKFESIGIYKGIVIQSLNTAASYSNSNFEMGLRAAQQAFANICDGAIGVSAHGSVPAIGVWYYYAFTWDQSDHEIKFFEQGGPVDSNINVAVIQVDDHQTFYLGENYAARELDAILDEVRVSFYERSDAWIKATGETGKDHLLTWGSEEAQSSRDLKAVFILISPGSADLKGKFIVKKTAFRSLFAVFWSGIPFQDLFARFEIGQDSRALFLKFAVRHPGSQPLFIKFIVRHSSSQTCFIKLIVRHSNSQTRLAKFIVRQSGEEGLKSISVVKHAAFRNLFTKFIIRRSAFVSRSAKFWIPFSSFRRLKGSFILVFPSEELPSKFIVRHGGVEEFEAEAFVKNPRRALFARFLARQSGSGMVDGIFHVGQNSAILKAVFRCAQESRALKAVFHSGQDSGDLKAGFEVGQGMAILRSVFEVDHVRDLHAAFSIQDSVVLKGFFRLTQEAMFAKFQVGQGSRGLPCESIVRHSAVLDLEGVSMIRHTGTARNLFASFVVHRFSDAADLRAVLELRQGYAELKCKFRAVRYSYEILVPDTYGWLNFVAGLGSAFIERPIITADSPGGISGARLESVVSAHRHEGVRFGWVAEKGWVLDERIYQSLKQLKANFYVMVDKLPLDEWSDVELAEGWWIWSWAGVYMQFVPEPVAGYFDLVCFNPFDIRMEMAGGGITMSMGTLKKYLEGTWVWEMQHVSPQPGPWAGQYGCEYFLGGISSHRVVGGVLENGCGIWYDPDAHAGTGGYYFWTNKDGSDTMVEIIGVDFTLKHTYKIVFESPATSPPNGRARLWIDDVLKATITTNISTDPMLWIWEVMGNWVDANTRTGIRVHSWTDQA